MFGKLPTLSPTSDLFPTTKINEKAEIPTPCTFSDQCGHPVNQPNQSLLNQRLSKLNTTSLSLVWIFLDGFPKCQHKGPKSYEMGSRNTIDSQLDLSWAWHSSAPACILLLSPSISAQTFEGCHCENMENKLGLSCAKLSIC